MSVFSAGTDEYAFWTIADGRVNVKPIAGPIVHASDWHENMEAEKINGGRRRKVKRWRTATLNESNWVRLSASPVWPPHFTYVSRTDLMKCTCEYRWWRENLNMRSIPRKHRQAGRMNDHRKQATSTKGAQEGISDTSYILTVG